MRLSVVIPTYGRPEDVYNLLRCIKRQSVKPLEVIVVDDTPSAIGNTSEYIWGTKVEI